MSVQTVNVFAAYAGAAAALNPAKFDFVSRVDRFEAGDPVWALGMSVERFEKCPLFVCIIEHERAPLVVVLDLTQPITSTIVGGHKFLAEGFGSAEIQAGCKEALQEGVLPVAVAHCYADSVEVTFHPGPRFRLLEPPEVAA